MREGRAAAQGIGRRMLTHKQLRRASLPYVMSLFQTTGLSEHERLELGYMLQKFVIEGYMKGVDLPRIIKRKTSEQGMLHIGFNDSDIPSANAITFDRGSWRSQTDPNRVSEFLGKLSSRLTSPSNRTSPPRSRNAARHFQEAPRTGALRVPVTQQAMDRIARRIVASVSPRRLDAAFSALREFQTQIGGTAPRLMDAVRQPMAAFERAIQNQLMDKQEVGFETREDLARRGMDPFQVASLPPRTGIASPRAIQNVGMRDIAGAQAPAGGRPNRVLMFAGGGTWSAEVADTEANLRAMGIQYDKVATLSGVDYSKYGAVFFPGGNAGPQWNAISGSEASRLKQAISGGLNYLGNCAGAFLAGQWGGGLGLTNTLIDYPQKSYPGGGAQVATPVKFNWNGQTRDIDFYGGPGLDAVVRNSNAKVLATFAGTGEAGIVSFNYGQGHVLLNAFHPGMIAPGDRDGSDDEIMRQLIQAAVTGTDPGGTPPGPPGSPPGTPPGTPPGGDVTTNIHNISPTQVNPGGGGAGEGVMGGRRAGRAQHRKTPVAGMLADVGTSSFAAGLQDAIRRSGPMLQGLAGALQGIGK